MHKYTGAGSFCGEANPGVEPRWVRAERRGGKQWDWPIAMYFSNAACWFSNRYPTLERRPATAAAAPHGAQRHPTPAVFLMPSRDTGAPGHVSISSGFSLTADRHLPKITWTSSYLLRRPGKWPDIAIGCARSGPDRIFFLTVVRWQTNQCEASGIPRRFRASTEYR